MCDLEISTMMWPRPEHGWCAKKYIYKYKDIYIRCRFVSPQTGNWKQ
jgi:hypothetical protein